MKEGSLFLTAPEPSLGILQELTTAAGLVFRDQPPVDSRGLSVGTAGMGGGAPEVVVEPTRASWPPLNAPQEWAGILQESLDQESLVLSGYEACTRLHGVRDTVSHSHYAAWLGNKFAGFPVMNLLAQRFQKQVLTAAEEHGVRLKQVPRWPPGKQYAVLLTHDIDYLSQFSLENARIFLGVALSPGSRETGSLSFARRLVNIIKAAIQVRGVLGRRLWGGRDRFWRNLEQLIDLEHRQGVRSTFFVAPFPEKGDRDPPYTCRSSFYFGGAEVKFLEWLRWVRSHGWEVGLHGSLSSSCSPERMKSEAEFMCGILGEKRLGNRQHCLSFKAGDTERVHANAEFLYDSSLGYNERLGFRNSAALPFYPRFGEAGNGARVLQIPLVIHDSVFYNLPYNEAKALADSWKIIEELKRHQGCGAILFHPCSNDGDKWQMMYGIYQDLLARLLQDETVWLTTAGELSRWWQTRSSLCAETDCPAPKPMEQGWQDEV